MRLRLAFASVLSAAGLLALAPAADAYGFKGHGFHGRGYYGGGYYGGFRGGYVGPAFGRGFRGGYPYNYPYYGGFSRFRGYPYYGGPSVVFATPPLVYPPASVRVIEVQRPLAQLAPPAGQSIAPPPAFVYYCESGRGFYPWVKECDEAWLEIPASPTPPGTPQAFEPPLSAEDLPPPPGAE